MLDPRLFELKCCVLPGHIRDCDRSYIEHYNSAYDFWRIFMGLEMQREHLDDIDKKLASDGFMLFEDIFTLFYRDKIIGFFCFDTKDLMSRAMWDQEFFKSFPSNIIHDYIKPAKKIMTIGHLLVHPDWRRSKIGIGLSDVLVWFMHKRFSESGCDLMIYWTRNNRSTNQLGTKHGGEVVLKDYSYGGLTADLIINRPEQNKVQCGDQQIDKISQRLWDTRIVCNVHAAVCHSPARAN